MIEKLNFAPETLKAMQAAYQLRPGFYEKAAGEAYRGEALDYPIIRRRPLERLVILGCCLKEIWKKYKNLGVPEEIILDTLQIRWCNEETAWSHWDATDEPMTA